MRSCPMLAGKSSQVMAVCVVRKVYGSTKGYSTHRISARITSRFVHRRRFSLCGCYAPARWET